MWIFTKTNGSVWKTRSLHNINTGLTYELRIPARKRKGHTIELFLLPPPNWVDWNVIPFMVGEQAAKFWAELVSDSRGGMMSLATRDEPKEYLDV